MNMDFEPLNGIDIRKDSSCALPGPCSVENNITSEKYLNSFTAKYAELPKSINFVQSAGVRLEFLRRRKAILVRRRKRIGIADEKCSEELQSTVTEACCLKRKREHAKWFDYYMAQIKKMAGGDRIIALNVAGGIMEAAEKFIKSDNPEEFQNDIERLRDMLALKPAASQDGNELLLKPKCTVVSVKDVHAGECDQENQQLQTDSKKDAIGLTPLEVLNANETL